MSGCASLDKAMTLDMHGRARPGRADALYLALRVGRAEQFPVLSAVYATTR
jgi:hypothetical protein